jgi:hypothetical protein
MKNSPCFFFLFPKKSTVQKSYEKWSFGVFFEPVIFGFQKRAKMAIFQTVFFEFGKYLKMAIFHNFLAARPRTRRAEFSLYTPPRKKSIDELDKIFSP